MSRKLNHHFVPQYHFRLFTYGNRYIHLASRDGRRFVKFASIKGQCARHKFYGDERLENWLECLESRHAAVYRAVLELARSSRTTPLSEEEDYHLREAILLQRSRTPRAARLLAASTDQIMLYTYCEHLKTLPAIAERQAIIDAIECGKAIVKNSQFASLVVSLSIAIRAVRAICDLSLLILRNHTAVPFVMSDSPCVFSNRYMRHIQHSGVLGLLTPGLMAVLPIDSRTQLLFYDPVVYTPEYSTGGCIDVFRKSDVSQLNALQIHSSEENVYFADVNSEGYLHELLLAHRSLLQNQQSRVVVHEDGKILIDGIPNTGKVVHAFEPQLPVTLNLSFIKTSPLPPKENPNRPRNPTLAREVIRARGGPGEPSPIPMDVFGQWIESQIYVLGDT